MTSRRLPALALGLSALAAAGGLTLAGTGVEAGDEQSPAAVAVRALVGGAPGQALAAVPEDFAAVRGYQPVLVDGQLVRADGGCSSPVPVPETFETACRQHDYGYDLLRYAAQSGEPLGRWARGAVDDQLAEGLHSSCPAGPDGDGCQRMATLAVTAVELNSIRQGDGVPEESVLTSGAVGTTAVAVLGIGAAVPGSRRRTAR